MSQKKKKMPRWRILSLILALCMVLTALPATSLWAAEGGTESANVTVGESTNEVVDEDGDTTEAEKETADEVPAVVVEESDASDDIGNPDVTENIQRETLADDEDEPNAKATDAPMSGNCGKNGGDNVKWTLDLEGGLTISGNGEMEDFKYFNASSSPWCRNHNIKTIVVQEGVKSIGNGAFWEVFNLTSITIASSVTRIGEYAFKGCYHIQNLVIPDGVITIDHHAFWGCDELKSVTISESVHSIGKLAFDNCIKLEEIYVEPQNTSYISKEGVLFNAQQTELIRCPSQKEGPYYIPDSVIHIAENAFSYCWRLTSVAMSDNVTNIDPYAFYGCGNLKRIKLSSQLEGISAGTFRDCRSLPSVIIPNGVTSIGMDAFRGCKSLLSIRIPRSMTSINGFYECYRLKYIFFCGDKNKWELIDGVASDTIIKNATVLYNSVDSDCKVYRDNGNEQFDCALEMCMRSVPSNYTYNPQLAHMLIAMCNSVYNSSNMFDTFSSFGFESRNMKYNSYLLGGSGGITLAYGVAKKQVGDRTLVLLVARGTNGYPWEDPLEWASNLHAIPNIQGRHKGFTNAANALYDELIGKDGFLGKTDLAKVDFVFTGFSRGAAATNILATRLLDEGISGDSIFAYNFACPDTFIDVNNTASNGKYGNIFNIANVNDFVSWAPSTILGSLWSKYGKSYWYSDVWDGSGDLKMGMGAHNQALYLEALRDQDDPDLDPESEFRQRSEAKASLDDAAAKRYVNTRPVNIGGRHIRRVIKGHCPVDMDIYSSDGSLVGSIVSNNIETNDYDKICICINGDEKDIYLLNPDKYTFTIKGTDNGVLEYSVQDIDVDSNQVVGEKIFSNVTLTNGKEMTSQVSIWDDNDENIKDEDKIDIQDVKLLVLDDKGEPEKEVLSDGEGTEVPITTTPSPSPEVSDSPSASPSPSPSAEPEPSVTEIPVVSPTVSPTPPVTTTVPSITLTPTNTPTPGGDIGNSVMVNRVKITGSSKKIAVGKKLKLKASVSPANATNKAVTWKSSNNKYATVNSKGIVTIKKAAGGKTVTITVMTKDGSGVKASYKIQCMKGVVKKVTIPGKKMRTVKAGKSIKLKAKVKATKGANKTLKWASSNTKYATVNSKGKVTTKKAGKGKTIKITATATDGSGKKASIKIKLK